MLRLRRLLVRLAFLLWLLSMAALLWAIAPMANTTEEVTLEPVDLAAPVPMAGTPTSTHIVPSDGTWMPSLQLHLELPPRLRAGTPARIDLKVAQADSLPARVVEHSLLVIASLHAAAARVEPAPEIALPLAEQGSGRFAWTVTSTGSGQVPLAFSLRVRMVSGGNGASGERLVWARSITLPSQRWLGLSAPAATWYGAAGTILGLIWIILTGKETARWLWTPRRRPKG